MFCKEQNTFDVLQSTLSEKFGMAIECGDPTTQQVRGGVMNSFDDKQC